MTGPRRGRPAALLAALALAACTPARPDSGFDEVRALAGDRVPHDLHWRQGGAADEAVDARLDAMLASPLTIDRAVQIALLNNRSLQVTYERIGLTQADVVAAGLLSNPVLFASGRFPDGGGRSNIEFGVVQEFLDVIMRPARMKLAAAKFRQVQFEVAQAVLDVATEVTVVGHEHAAARQVSDVRRLVAQSAQASIDLALRMHEAGNLADLSLAREQAAYEMARLDWARSESALAATRERLNRLLGLWGEQIAWTWNADLPPLPEVDPDLTDLESMAMARRFDLAAARQEADIVAASLGLVRRTGGLTSVEIGGNAERETDGTWVSGPTLAVAVPLFDQGQANRARLESRLRQADQETARLAVEIRADVRGLRDQLVAARRVAAHFRDVVVPLHERIVALSQEQYNFMLIGVFEAIVARQAEFDAYEAYVDAVRDYWITRTRLEHAASGPLPDHAGPASRPATQPQTMPPTTRPAATSEDQHHQHGGES